MPQYEIKGNYEKRIATQKNLLSHQKVKVSDIAEILVASMQDLDLGLKPGLSGNEIDRYSAEIFKAGDKQTRISNGIQALKNAHCDIRDFYKTIDRLENAVKSLYKLTAKGIRKPNTKTHDTLYQKLTELKDKIMENPLTMWDKVPVKYAFEGIQLYDLETGTKTQELPKLSTQTLRYSFDPEVSKKTLAGKKSDKVTSDKTQVY